VVAYRSPGVDELVRDGETGLLVPTADLEGFADAATRILNDPDLAARLGRTARDHTRRFSIERHVEELTRIYEQFAPSASSGHASRPPVAGARGSST
jgi:glycosyltransferase involved in cell wall biosynthesis